MEQLTVAEYADLKGITSRGVRKLISEGKLQATISFGSGGASGRGYLIPLAAIEPKLQKKYMRIHREKFPEPETKPVAVKCLEDLSFEERQEVNRWKEILQEWREYRNGYEGCMEQADEAFVQYLQIQYPGMKFSRRILQRQWKALQEQGEGALIDRRGKHGNHKKTIPDEVFDVFQYYYLDQAQMSVKKCMELTELYLKGQGKEGLLPLASSGTFARKIVNGGIPVPVLKYYRKGEKAFRDACAPYIQRTYEDLYSNDIWVCDNHTFDVFVNDGEHQKPVRVYLTAFLDIRSRKMMGWYVTLNPCSDATLFALRRGIERYGIPKRILSDNGREFLTFDIGGRGFRTSRKDGEHVAPTILDNLGIEFRTALPTNARAKIIERAFRDVKEDFSKLFEGYTGGTIAERPERLKKTGKLAENFTLLPEFIKYVDTYIEGYFNTRSHSGSGMNGKTRNEVYAAELVEKRTATREQLNLMMLRNTRMQTVQRNGVYLGLYDMKIYFNSVELNWSHLKEKVYFRYNPDDLSEVRVYDEQDRFLCTAQQIAKLSYFATKEQVAEAMRENRRLEQLVKRYKKDKDLKGEKAVDLIMREAKRLMGGQEPDPKILTPVAFSEKTLFEEHGYVNAAPIDYTEALERMAAAK
ncbi:MAG: transposase [Lachnospiraceae bacterium]|nr:transposase [Lachnospiraceae bacterium]